MLVARKDKMDLAVNIAIGSSGADRAVRRARCSSWLVLHRRRTRCRSCSTASSSAAIILAVLIAIHVTSEGESTWFEGLQLLAVYVVLAVTFYFA